MQKEYGYKKIYEELRTRIMNKIYPPGSKLPPERLLCDEWKVERTTIRRALSMLENDGLIIKKAGYGSVVAKAGESAPLISFLAPGITGRNGNPINHHFISPVYDAFAELCGENGYRSICMTISGTNCEESFDTILRTSRGVILADNVPTEVIRRTKELRVPCVLMSERAVGFRSVLCDNDSGLMQVVAHLSGLGHRNIAYIGGDRVYLNSSARADGFLRAMEACGLDDTRPLIDLAGWGVQDGFNATKRILGLNAGITAICAVNDYVALGAYRALMDSTKSVPGEFSVAGFGDTVNEELSQISLTTVRVTYKRFARELFRSLLWEIEHPYEDPATVLVEAELLIRGTTGPVGKK